MCVLVWGVWRDGQALEVIPRTLVQVGGWVGVCEGVGRVCACVGCVEGWAGFQ